MTTEEKNITAEEKDEDDKLVFDLSKEYKFDGKTYKKVDLRGLENITADDMIKVNRRLSRGGNIDFMQEITLEYACVLAEFGSELPESFYRGLAPKDAMKLKSRITGFLYGSN